MTENNKDLEDEVKKLNEKETIFTHTIEEYKKKLEGRENKDRLIQNDILQN
jgi:hypothetical protein